MKKQLQQKQSGFTIIEVMIVLAIAALILVVVLIAIPQLQRNQRNQARQSTTARIAAEINNYAGNNNGTFPTANSNATTGFTGGFASRYFSNLQVEDPITGNSVLDSGNVTFTGNEPGSDAGNLYYSFNRICEGEVATSSGAGTRTFALIMRLEGGAGYCLDNR